VENNLSELWRLFPHTFAQKMSGGAWVPYSYLKRISQEITECIAKGNGRLIVEVPARHGKSTLISQWVPFWYLSLFPEKNIIFATYEADFAAVWGRRVRNEIQDNPLATIKVSDDSSAAHRWGTVQGGGMITAGVGGPITGRGGNLILVDDVCKNAEEARSETYQKRTIDWFNSTLYTRREPGATIIILGTRWNQNDLQGHLQSVHKEKWKVLRFPALAEENDSLGRAINEPLCPERFDLSALQEIKQSIGTYYWNALYQQRPSSEEGNFLKKEWWRFWSVLPDKFDEKIICMDLAFSGKSTSDYVVIQIWGRKGSEKYLIDQVRRRMDFPQTIQAVKSLVERYPDAYAKIVEEKANGAALIDSLKKEISGLIPFNPKTSKEARVMAVSPQVEAGNVYLPNPTIYPWVGDLLEELSQFPNGKNDDQVDCLSMALLRFGAASGNIDLSYSISPIRPLAPGLDSDDIW
jgi:predicted phage terminase large subunit-like protein